MMGGVAPETCWASYKYGIIKFWYIVASCWTFLYELYYGALIHEHRVISIYVSRLEVEQMASKEFKGIYNRIILYIILTSSSKAL